MDREMNFDKNDDFFGRAESVTLGTQKVILFQMIAQK